MTFIDHLDELRKRLIRFLIVLMLCVLAAYGFRKEILDLIRKPVDAPLKKYTSTEEYQQEKAKVPITSLNAYNCSCEEIPVPSAPLPQTMDKKVETAAEQQTEATGDSIRAKADDPSVNMDELAEQAGDWMEIVKNAVNDFVVFFQVTIGKDPSPVFETSQYLVKSEQQGSGTPGYQPIPGKLNLNCECTLSSPAVEPLNAHSSMVFIGLPELFFAQMKVAVFAGFFISFPYLLIQIWGFVGPALYRGEKRVFWIFAISSYIFFIGGALFGYFVVFPYGFDFFLSLTQMGEIMPSLSVGQYLGFAIKLLLAFGFIFELPLATFILARMGVVTPEIMIKQARIAIMIVFILSAMLTPPDPFTMMLMAGPLIVLYILSIGVCFVGINRQKAALRKQGVDLDDLEF